MAHQSVGRSLLGLVRSFRTLNTTDPLTQCLAPRLACGFATETNLPASDFAGLSTSDYARSTDVLKPTPKSARAADLDPSARVLTTLYSWPALEPAEFAWYSPKYLNMPLRRDLLHRAVVFEGDATRQGTASTKWRADVHGSNRKIMRQKGSGRARVGDKKSPIRRGGGVAFGPKPRDFSTDLPRKVYDIAWRTALSYRYWKGELRIVADDISIPESASPRFLANLFVANSLGKGNGRSMLVTNYRRPELFEAMGEVGEHGLVKDIEDVDVKDLLETGRILIERRALHNLLAAHSSDLGPDTSLNPGAKWKLNPMDGMLVHPGTKMGLVE